MPARSRWTFSVWEARAFLALVFGVCAFVSGCGSSGANVELARRSVETFHDQLDAQQFGAVYATSDEKFRSATSEADLTKLLDAVHRKLGNVQQADLRNTGMAWFAGQGSTVTLVYQTKFAEGNATERFVWHIKDKDATLYSYNINSNDLVTK